MSKREQRLTIEQITDLIYQYASDAYVEKDPERTELIKKALSLSCNFLIRLNDELESYIYDAFAKSGLNPEGTPVQVSDLARSNDELEVFLNQQNRRKFLNALGQSLLLQGHLDHERVADLKKTVLESYDKMVAQPLQKDELTKNFLILKSICCRSPDGPDGSATASDPPDKDPKSGGRWERALTILANLATIAQLFLALNQSPSVAAPSQPPPPPTPIKIILLLMLSLTADEILGLGLLPTELEEIIENGSSTHEIVKNLREALKPKAKQQVAYA